MEDAAPQTYAVTLGGPLCRLERRLHIMRDGPGDLARRIAVVIALAYAPVLAVGLERRIVTGSWAPALQELTTHVRALVILPLLLAGQQWIDERAVGAGRYLFESNILGQECLERYRSVISRTARLRDSNAVEAALLAGAIGSLFVAPAFTRDVEAAMVWSLQPSALLYRFLATRLLWRWCLWAWFLFQLSRLPLTLRATHPDRAAGLSPLTEPSVAFGVVVMSGASATAASWGDRMTFEGVPAEAFSSAAVAYLIVAFVVTAAPLWVFTGRLIAVHLEGQRAYAALASRYALAFERRWFDRSGEEALGAADFQTLNDLGGSFDRVQQIRPVLTTRAMAAAVVVGVALPLLPLFLAEVGTATLLSRLAKALI